MKKELGVYIKQRSSLFPVASVDDVLLSVDGVRLARSSQPLLQPNILAGLFSIIGIHFGILPSHHVERDGALMALLTKQCRPVARAASNKAILRNCSSKFAILVAWEKKKVRFCFLLIMIIVSYTIESSLVGLGVFRFNRWFI